MSSIPKYIRLIKLIKNWPAYFKRRQERGLTTTYTTRGVPLSFDVPPLFYQVFREIFMEDFYRIEELVKHLPAAPVVVDIGGNVGYFSFMIAAKRRQARIYAFEPMQANVQLFRKNISLNPTLRERIHVFENAVTGDYNGPIELFFDGVTNNSVVASVIKDFSSHNTDTKQVHALSLEMIFSQNGLDQIDLLKIDCEGSEYPVFYDSPAALFNKIKIIAIETHDLDNGKRNTHSLIAFLEQKGYTTESIMGENHCYYVKAFRK